MAGFILRRVLMGLVTVLTAVVLVFVVVHLAPGSPGAVILGAGASQAQVDAFNKALGWDQPLMLQLGQYLTGLLHGDLGTSLVDHSSVTADLVSRLQVTGSIALLSTALSAVLGVGLGLIAAVRGSLVDRSVVVANGIAMSLPSFWLAVVLVFVVAVQFRWLPATGYVPPSASVGGWIVSLALPVVALSIGAIAVIARTARVALREAMGRPSIRVLRSVGTPPWRLLLVHALRGASLPIVSMIGIQFVVLFSGSIVVEGLFGLPGLGQAMSNAVTYHDTPMTMGVVIITAFVVVLMTLALDLVTGFLDPRVRAR